MIGRVGGNSSPKDSLALVVDIADQVVLDRGQLQRAVVYGLRARAVRGASH